MAWNPILCSRSDLETEVGDLTLWTQVEDPECDSLITDAIATVGKNITNELLAYLPELYVTTIGVYSNLPFADWLVMRGYSYDDLDSVLDEITNPEVLNPWAIARTLHQLSVRMIAKFQVIGGTTLQVMVDQRKYWGGMDGTEGVSFLRWKSCVKQLKIDLNKDGNIRDFSRPRTHRDFLRR